MIRALLAVVILALPSAATQAPRSEMTRPRVAMAPSPQFAAWRLLERHAGPHAPSLYRVAYRESRFRPEARNRHSGAAGLFQFLPGTWETARSGSGLPATATPYDPEAATVAAAWLYAQPRGPRHWRAHGHR